MSSAVLRAVLAMALTLSFQANAQTADAPAIEAAPTAQSPNDYSQADNWLCRPGRKDACTVDLSTTVVAANGKLRREKFVAAAKAPIDCFYVYPTISEDATPNSDMTAGPEELAVIREQAARFASKCRVYAPLYRQITLTALRSRLAGKPLPSDRMLAYNDVLDAWNHYLENDNQNRGVVLIGHSQGASLLSSLIRQEIDGKPVQSRIVSALLIGTNIAVPMGKDVGGAFQQMPLCKAASQIGCIVSYVSFRDTVPPPESSLFGKVPEDGMVAACVNPAALGGGNGELRAYLLSTERSLRTSELPKPWIASDAKIDTPFVSVPGLLESQCVSKDGFSYLAVHVQANPSDPRTDDVVGDVVVDGVVRTNWGLHLIDVDLTMGNLIDIVARQAREYTSRRK